MDYSFFRTVYFKEYIVFFNCTERNCSCLKHTILNNELSMTKLVYFTSTESWVTASILTFKNGEWTGLAFIEKFQLVSSFFPIIIK